jgi:TolA-binding protein
LLKELFFSKKTKGIRKRMNRQNNNISRKMGQQENNSWDDTDMLLRPEDSALFGKISDYMTGCLDIEDVKSDPLFKETYEAAGEMTSGFDHNAPVHKAHSKFISENIPGENEEKMLADEISDIESENRKNDLANITASWVREWNEKKKNRISVDSKSEERKEFVANSIADAESDSESDTKKVSRKTIFARFTLPAAAAVIGAIFLVKLLLPSYNPDKLFIKYYEPIRAISPVTRSADAVETGSYASAIENYNNKNYQAAVAGFSDAILKDPLDISPRFFLGITQMALGNYGQAENVLEDVIGRQSEYAKEARWYLGLAYIKTGNKDKASVCFGILAQWPGFYSDRAEEILRRLK